MFYVADISNLVLDEKVVGVVAQSKALGNTIILLQLNPVTRAKSSLKTKCTCSVVIYYICFEPIQAQTTLQHKTTLL